MAKNDSPYLTSGERIRNFVGIAFVLSIFLHFLAAPILERVMRLANRECWLIFTKV